jgi:hypothetical protein
MDPLATTYATVQPVNSVECQAVFIHKPRSWNFSVPSGVSVDKAIAEAKEQARQRNALPAGKHVEEQLSVTAVPSASRESLVGDWNRMNSNQPPLVIISRSQKDDAAFTPVESASQEAQRIMEEQLVMLSVLQKQLIEQSSVVQNQETLIAELQSRSRQQWNQLQECVESFESDISEMKGQMQVFQERIFEDRAGKPSAGDKKDARRRRRH